MTAFIKLLQCPFQSFKIGFLSLFLFWQNQASARPLPGTDETLHAAHTSNNEHFNNHHKLMPDVVVDSMAVHKAAHEMLVFSNGKLLKRYAVCLGKNPTGAKQFEGDFKTPEGHYYINAKNPACRYHKGLQISYPNKTDVERAKKMGKSAGGAILIHGLPNGQENVGPNRYRNDWTWGCVALRNNEIDELFARVKVGTPILITKWSRLFHTVSQLINS